MGQFSSVSGMSHCAMGTKGREAVQCHSCQVNSFSAETWIQGCSVVHLHYPNSSDMRSQENFYTMKNTAFLEQTLFHLIDIYEK